MQLFPKHLLGMDVDGQRNINDDGNLTRARKLLTDAMFIDLDNLIPQELQKMLEEK